MKNDQFKFDLNAKKIRITNSDIIDSLKLFHAIQKGPFTTREYDKWDKRICVSDIIIRRFGTWRKALTKIGVSSGVQAHKYTVEELMENLEIIWRELGRPPGEKVLASRGYRISEKPYRNRWGSVANACKQLKLFKEGKIKQTELLGTQKASARKSISLKIRWDVLKRDNYQCVRCGRRPPDVQLQVDHKDPRSKGGADTEENLRTLCKECNAGKSNRDG